MSKEVKDNGGPAFPQHVHPAYQQDPDIWGMSQRDYFAAKAMQGQIAYDQNQRVEHVAQWAYAMADAMLEARKS